MLPRRRFCLGPRREHPLLGGECEFLGNIFDFGLVFNCLSANSTSSSDFVSAPDSP